MEAGAYENVFGDANFIIRKDSFISVGGFKEDRGTSYEDWDFLARLAIAGYQIDVIPDFLFLYRHTEDGFSRTTSTYQNHNRVLKAYFEATPIWNKRLISNSVGYFSHVQLNSHYQQTIEAMESSKFWKLRKIWFKFKRQLRLTDSES